jgi:hypothetical protein
MDGVVAKPVEVATLFSVIERALAGDEPAEHALQSANG